MKNAKCFSLKVDVSGPPLPKYVFPYIFGLTKGIDQRNSMSVSTTCSREYTIHARGAADTALFASRGMHTYASWNCREHAWKTDMEEKKLVNKVITRSFIILWLKH